MRVGIEMSAPPIHGTEELIYTNVVTMSLY